MFAAPKKKLPLPRPSKRCFLEALSYVFKKNTRNLHLKLRRSLSFGSSVSLLPQQILTLKQDLANLTIGTRRMSFHLLRKCVRIKKKRTSTGHFIPQGGSEDHERNTSRMTRNPPKITKRSQKNPKSPKKSKKNPSSWAQKNFSKKSLASYYRPQRSRS